MNAICQLVAAPFACSFILCVAADALAQAPDQPGYANKPPSFYIQQLTDSDINVRRRAAYVLGRINAPAETAVPALVEALKDGRMEMRWYAIDALGRFGPDAAPAVEAIIKALKSKNAELAGYETVLRRGARSLGNIGPAAEAAVPVLEEALSAGDALYRIAAAEALWRIARHEQAIPVLTEELQSDDARAAFAAALALGELPDAGDRAIGPLVRALAHEDADVRQAAVDALVRIGPPAIEPLSKYVAKNQPVGRDDAARALGMITAQLREQTLYVDKTPERDFAAAASPLVLKAFPALAHGLGSDDEPLRLACENALAKGGSIAVPQLLTVLRGDDATARSAAAVALVRLESRLPKQRPLSANVERVHQKIIDQLVAALATEDATVQKASVRLFAALDIGADGAAAEPLLRRALETGDLATRRYADKALKRLAAAEANP